MCGNRAVYSTVIPRGTDPNRRFPLSQQYNRRQMKHEGSSSSRACYGAFGNWTTTSESVDRCNVGAVQKRFRRLFSHLRSWVWSTALSGIIDDRVRTSSMVVLSVQTAVIITHRQRPRDLTVLSTWATPIKLYTTCQANKSDQTSVWSDICLINSKES